MVRKGSPVRVRKRAYRVPLPTVLFGLVDASDPFGCQEVPLWCGADPPVASSCAGGSPGVHRRCGTPEDNLALEPESPCRAAPPQRRRITSPSDLILATTSDA